MSPDDFILLAEEEWAPTLLGLMIQLHLWMAMRIITAHTGHSTMEVIREKPYNNFSVAHVWFDLSFYGKKQSSVRQVGRSQRDTRRKPCNRWRCSFNLERETGKVSIWRETTETYCGKQEESWAWGIMGVVVLVRGQAEWWSEDCNWCCEVWKGMRVSEWLRCVFGYAVCRVTDNGYGSQECRGHMIPHHNDGEAKRKEAGETRSSHIS